ncbi:MAG: hypothetical protein FWG88_04780 [Oscillospiraceae bacterium]|nr:hypothetical protein [Oscillospiraceae bacterium]
MSKTFKKLLVALTLLCVVVLFVFTIQLFALNRGRDDGENRQSDTLNSTSENDGDNDDVSNSNNGQVGDNSPNNGTGNQNTLPPSGTRYELQYTADMNLVVYVDDEQFLHSEPEWAHMFTLESTDDSWLLLHFLGLPLGAQRLAEGFLNEYLDGAESSVHGLVQIRGSELTGVYVTGTSDGGETYEAWIHTISKDDVDQAEAYGMVFVVRYRYNEQKNLLFSILDSMELVPVSN